MLEQERVRNEQQMKGTAQMPSDEAMSTHSTQQAGSRSENCQAAVQSLGSREAEKSGKVRWDAEQLERDLFRACGTGIACEPLDSREPVMGTLRPRKVSRSKGRASGGGSIEPHLDTLVAQQVHTRPAMCSAAPILPEQRGGAHAQRMKQDTDLARLLRLVAVPLTLLTQWATATVCNPGRIDDAQAAARFAASFASKEALTRRTAHGPIWLEGKGCSRKAPGFPRATDHRRCVALLRCLPHFGL